MKISDFSRCRWGLVLTLAVAATASGCRSTSWKMPGSSFFASREPDAATLAGNTGAPQLPESPATKYSPSSMASVGKQPGTTSPGSAGQPAAGTSPYGYTAGGTSNPASASAPAGGLAARANGYQTGPYAVGQASGSATAAGLAANLNSAASYPSPYGGSYSGSTGTPNIELPNSVNGALAGAAQAMPGYPAAGTYGSAAAAGGLPAYPPAAGYNATPAPAGATVGAGGYASNTTPSGIGNGPSSQNSLVNYPSPTNPTPGTGTLPPGSSQASALPYPPLPGAGNGTMNTNPSATLPPASSAYKGAGSYSPGTTGRPTSYDFSTTGATTASGSTPVNPSATLPPNTASAPGMPNSSLVR